MRKKKLITLAKELDFITELDYFDYCIDSHINGQKDQCKELFYDMCKADRKRLITYCNNHDHVLISNYYFGLL
jgi:hypothetical protein